MDVWEVVLLATCIITASSVILSSKAPSLDILHICKACKTLNCMTFKFALKQQHKVILWPFVL